MGPVVRIRSHKKMKAARWNPSQEGHLHHKGPGAQGGEGPPSRSRRCRAALGSLQPCLLRPPGLVLLALAFSLLPALEGLP